MLGFFIVNPDIVVSGFTLPLAVVCLTAFGEVLHLYVLGGNVINGGHPLFHDPLYIGGIGDEDVVEEYLYVYWRLFDARLLRVIYDGLAPAFFPFIVHRLFEPLRFSFG